ncbi:MAG TPA: aldo/keto reductase [Bordetella sp.]|nr:aldo/keto reductase [Bordetella sp.]
MPNASVRSPQDWRPFGSTGLRLSALALGGHEYLADGRSRGFNEDMKQAVSPGYVGSGYGGPKRKQVLAAAYDLGINVFDVTIDSEKEALGRNLRDMPPPYEIHVQTRPEGMCYSYDRNNRKLLDYALLRAEVQRGLKLLGRDCIDLFNVGLLSWSIDHDPDYMSVLAENLARLKREGLIRHAVADSFSGERLYLAMLRSGAFDAVNVDLNLGDAQALQTVLPAAGGAGMGRIVREAFFKGALFRIGVEAGIGDKAVLARLALKWVALHRPDVLIVGVDDADQLRANAASFQSAWTSDDEVLLARLRRVPAFRQYETDKFLEFFPAPAGDEQP